MLLLATGSEVQLAVEAREALQAEGIATRVVSIPCLEWFNKQDAAYRESVLPAAVKARVSVEAGVAMGWRELVGDAGRIISLEHYGASADYKRLYSGVRHHRGSNHRRRQGLHSAGPSRA